MPGFIFEVLSEIDEWQNQKFEISKELFLTQRDKIDLVDRIQSVEKSIIKNVYIVGLVQFLGIAASVLVINYKFYDTEITAKCYKETSFCLRSPFVIPYRLPFLLH